MVTLSGRDAFRSELTAVAGRDGRVVCLETLSRSKDHPFEAAHPDRFFSVPNAGSVLTQMVTGLGAAGFRPFVVVTPGAVKGRAVAPRSLWRDCLQAGATVVMPPEQFPEGYDEVRGLYGIPLAVPCGEEETRAVVRQAVRTGRPHCLVLGEGAGVDLSWESSEPSMAAARLISVGEAGTRLALAARAVAPGLGHAHLVYLDDVRLSAAAAELGAWTGKSVVVAAPRLLGPVVRALRARLPVDSVRGVPAAVGAGAGAEVAEVLAAAAG
ncbi:hypothetical protein ABZ471_17000 [Streptomyces sp. NPDC005728]|uniref:hypothetical protein n=1 Tax=Streptomyces sp. NPDC005728 TaxID=3157054 RepID=UPI0033CFDD30